MSAITLPKVLECFDNGLASLDAQIDRYNQEIKRIEEKRDKALVEAALQRAATKALAALDAELGKDNSTLTLRFPS